ncbi:MAG: cytochrome C biogenesis protein ResB [Nitrospirae bacterium]|nr:MAG: cytochrome C biogenesis protein ResB [Nitrospirota bacterium]
MKRVLKILTSLKTTNLLLGLLILLFTGGAFVMPRSASFQRLHQMSLFEWLKEAPISSSWWLLASIGVLLVLALNTLFCSVDSLLKKPKGRNFLLYISPQIIHLGFCFILFAHLLSSAWAYHLFGLFNEGTSTRLPDGTVMVLERIEYRLQSGYITSMKALLRVKGKEERSFYLEPNHPALVSGYGVYLKQIGINPFPRALIEVSYEPGAVWALIGGILFALGTVTLILLKLKRGQG